MHYCVIIEITNTHACKTRKINLRDLQVQNIVCLYRSAFTLLKKSLLLVFIFLRIFYSHLSESGPSRLVSKWREISGLEVILGFVVCIVWIKPYLEQTWSSNIHISTKINLFNYQICPRN